MKKIFYIAVVIIFSVQLFAQNQKYKIENFMVTYEMKTNTMKTNTFMYVNNYGETEVSEVKMSVFGNEIHTRSLTNKEYIYQFDMVKKIGKKIPISTLKNDDETNVIDYDNLTKEVKEKHKIKEVGSEDVLNRTCKIIETEVNGVKLKLWVWKNIALKTEIKQKEMTVVIKAIKLDINPSFPAGIFEIPMDIKID